MMYKISIDRLGELFSSMADERILYLPVDRNGQTEFGQWSEDEKVCLDSVNTDKSPKDLFFPQSENIVAFKTRGQEISIIDNREQSEPFIVFGVRGCDVVSLEILDRVFLQEPVDTFYKARRDNGLIISLACNAPEETCFCNAFGIDATEPSGDISTWIIGETLYWKDITDRGEAFTESIKGIFESTDSSDKALLKEHKEGVQKIIDRLPLGDLDLEGFDSEALNEKFDSPKWKELSEACIGCGTCTFVCPTCQCYDIKDYDTGQGIQRFRCWDSCMYSDFTRMAHGNPRTSQVERFRQRFMHKLVYYPANNDGIYSCVGCGRCLAKCPVSMNIVKVIRAMGVDENV